MQRQCSFEKLCFFAPIMPKIMLAQSVKAYPPSPPHLPKNEPSHELLQDTIAEVHFNSRGVAEQWHIGEGVDGERRAEGL